MVSVKKSQIHHITSGRDMSAKSCDCMLTVVLALPVVSEPKNQQLSEISPDFYYVKKYT